MKEVLPAILYFICFGTPLACGKFARTKHGNLTRGTLKTINKMKNTDQNANNWNWHFIANTPDELAKIGDTLFFGPKQKHLDEQVQMTRLLEIISSAATLHFPVYVRYAGENETPDFQLESGGRRIAVEVCKIAVQDVEHARGLQRKEIKQTLEIGSLLRYRSKPRTKDEIIDEGFPTIPQFVFPVSIPDQNEIWLKAVASELTDKTKALRAKHFDHGSEDWLVLWDRIGTTEDAMEQRIAFVREIFALHWNLNWYSRVFLQDEHHHWVAMFSFTDNKMLFR